MRVGPSVGEVDGVRDGLTVGVNVGELVGAELWILLTQRAAHLVVKVLLRKLHTAFTPQISCLESHSQPIAPEAAQITEHA